MQSSNRVRQIRAGCHCSQCSPWIVHVYDGEQVKLKNARAHVGRRSKHGRSKPKGQHAYRRGLVG